MRLLILRLFVAALHPQFRLRCFGWDQTAVDFLTPRPGGSLVLQLTRWTPFTSLSAGAATLCASDDARNTTCWGECNFDNAAITQSGMCVLPAINSFSASSPGLAHTCALSPSGTLSCFSSTSALAFAPSGAFFNVASADNFTCAIMTNTSLACFGAVATAIASAQAQTAASPAAAVLFSNASFVVLKGPFSTASAGGLAAGAAFACALVMPSGTPLCIGDNSTLQLAAPTSPPLSALACGAAHACGMSLASGTAVCWGSDSAGQVTGAAAYAATPFSSLALTSRSSCGLTVGGVLKCWGGLAALMGLAIRAPSPPSLSNVTAITVGAPGASDAICAQSVPCAAAPASLGCAQTMACATLAGAVAALVANPALRALPVRGIAVLASHTSAPIAIPSWLAPGLLITGFPAGGARPVVTIAAPSPGMTLVWAANTGVVLANLAIDGSAAPGCDTALAIVGLYNYASNVTFQNLRCSRAVVTATSGSAAAAAAAPAGTTYASNTFQLDTVAFSNVSAPVYVSVWAQPAVGLLGVTAVHTGPGPAGFLAVWGGVLQMSVARVTLANFTTLAGTVLGPSGSAFAGVAAQGAAIYISGAPLVTLSSIAVTNVSSAAGGAALCVVSAGLARPLLSLTDVTVAGAASGGSGGAISVSVDANSAPAGVSVLLTRVNVSRASAAGSGGALFVRAPGLAVLVASSTFASSQSIGGSGGAIAVAAASSFVLSASAVRTAAAAGDGGALWVATVPTVSLLSFTITSAASGGGGGGVFVANFSIVSLVGTAISGSSAAGGVGGGGLAAVCAAAAATICSMQLSSSTLSGNAALAGNGGGMLATSSSSMQQVLLNASGSTFANNSAAGFGGGLFFDSTPYVLLAGCALVGNTAVRGGGLYARP